MLPSYSRTVADRICEQLAAGRTLTKICADDGMPPRATVWLWRDTDVDGFAGRYAQARLNGYAELVDQLRDAADGPLQGTVTTIDKDGVSVRTEDNVARSRLIVDTLKWALAKALPKIYGPPALAAMGLDADGKIVVTGGLPLPPVED